MTQVLVNGRAGAAVDPLDRGLLYGDGLFETVAIVGGLPRFLDWHFERLSSGARALGFPAPDLDALRADITQVATAPRCVVKLVLTRGLGERGYRPPRDPRPTRIVAASPWPVWPADAATSGVRLGWCRTRLARNTALAGLKHLNRLEQVLARAEWDDGALDEGLMQDDRGRVIAATQANVFAHIDGAWATPRLDQCGVAGVMRRAFRAWCAEQRMPVEERTLEVAEIASATSLVLTNALIGAWPVAVLDGRRFAVAPAAAAFNAWLAQQ